MTMEKVNRDFFFYLTIMIDALQETTAKPLVRGSPNE
jgi:hypothetical protein